MKVLISSYVHWWNAEAAYAAARAEVLRDAGHQVLVLTRPGTRNEEHLRQKGLPVNTEIPLHSSNPLRLAAALRRLRRLQREGGYEVVDVFHARELPWHLLAAGRLGLGWLRAPLAGLRPAVVRTRGNARGARGHILNRLLHGRLCQGLIASAEVVRRQMLDSLALTPEQVQTIYYPAPDRAEIPAPQAAAARRLLLEQTGLKPQSRLLALVGRIAPVKGHDHMLRALVRLGEAHPDAALLVLNKDYPGEREHRQELERRIGELGLAGRVRIMGFRQDVHELMGAVDIGVIPSLASETNCRVAVEFFAAGTPVVAYPTGALPEVVEHGVSGLVTPAGAPEHLAAALESILGDRALLERLGRGARQSAGERFSRERFLEQTLAVYHRALAACHRAPGAP